MPKVGPKTENNVLVVYDTDNGGFGGPLDMSGPEIGVLAYSEPGDNLHITINIEFGQPNTSYEVFLVGGPAHALATGFIGIGVLTTNAVGAGSGTFTVPHTTLLASPFGPGYRTDHIDLLHGLGDLSRGCLTAGEINYFACREKEQPTHPGFKMAEGKERASGKGDPLGERATSSDPIAGKKR
jgi:hypothetical protein